MATISITTPDNKGSNTTICVPSQNKAINREQRYQFEKTNATNLGNPPANINSTNYSVAHSEEGSARRDSSSCVTQECDHGHTATADYQVMYGIPLLRGNDIADVHSHSQSPTHSFQNISEDHGHYSKDKDSDTEAKEAIESANELYHSHDYSLMMMVLLRVRITPQMYSKYSMALYFGLGLAHFKMSDYDMATSNFLKAQKIAESNNDLGTRSLLEYYLAEIEYAQNKFLSSAGYYEQAITHRRQDSCIGKMFDIEVPSLSVLYCRQGTTLRYGSKVMEAVKMYREAIRSAINKEDELSAHTNLGNLFQAIGDFARAVEEYTKTIQLGEEIKDYVSLGWAHGNIGNAYLGLSKRDKALQHLDKALDLTLKHEPSPLAIGRALNNLGTAYQAVGNIKEAKDFYDRSLSQAVYGSDLPGQARVYGNLGNILMVQEKYSEAIAHYTETLTISRDRATQTTAYHNRGCARYERAETERKAYLEKEGIENGHLSLVFHGSEVQKHEDGYVKLPDQIQKHYRSAQSDLEKVMKYHEQTLNNIKGSATGLNLSVSLFETNSRTFQRLQDCSYCIGNWTQALVFAEQSRARTLGELMLKKKEEDPEVSSYRTPLDLPQIINIIKRLKLPVLYMSFTGVRLLVWLLVATNKDSSSDLSINMFQVHIPSDYFEDKSFDHVVRYQLTEKLCDMVNMYEPCQYGTDTLLNKLHKLIAEPLLHLLEVAPLSDMPSNEIILIPDSYTRLLPMSALQDTTTREFLGDQIRFHIMNSLLTTGILYQLPKAIVSIPLDSKNTCIVGNPSTPPFYWKGEAWRLGRLPHSEDEANRVAFTLETTPIVGHEASKEVVMSKIKHSKIIHFATHGCASGGFLVFSGSSKDIRQSDPQSLLLFSEEIEKLTTPAALVVLSSCDSGRGMFKADGIQGMARSFLLAGAHTVLTSLWRVPDESACYFMHYFYRYLVDGFPSYTALQKACLSIRCYKKYGEYIHWSGYQLQGREISIVNTSIEHGEPFHALGLTSSFPNLEKMSLLAENLIQTPRKPKHHSKASQSSQKTDVQLLIGSQATYPLELIMDYIASEWSYYTGGIFWFPGHCPDLITASLVHVNELRSVSTKPSDVHESITVVAEYFSNLDRPALLILHHFLYLPLDILPLSRLMHNKNISIIITAPISVTSKSIVSIAHSELSRGCVPTELLPLPFDQMMQRTVYHILSKYEFHPMNEDQNTLDDIEDLLCGSAVVSKLCFSTLDYFIERRGQDVGKGLETFTNEVIEPTRSMSERMIDYQVKDEKPNDKVKGNFGDGFLPAQEEEAFDEGGSVQATEGLISDTAKVHRRTSRSLEELEELPNPVVLVFACQLICCLPCSPLERVLMNCLSVLNSAPFHRTVLHSLEVDIRGYVALGTVNREDHNLSGTLMKYSIIVPYPSPVIKLPVSSRAILSDKDTPSYYHMPEAISEAVYLSLKEVDKVMACAILNRTLNELQSRRYDALMEGTIKGEGSEDVNYFDIHVVGLKRVLLSCLLDEWKVFMQETVEGIIKQYITDKTDTVGDYGVLELVNNLIHLNKR